MSGSIQITAPDGHTFDCYAAKAQGKARGAVLVLQEIFGVNTHIRAVADRLAASGYDAYAPALFDRLQKNFTTGYTPENVEVARGFLPKVNWDHIVTDTLATVVHARNATGGKVAIMGFCLGASAAWMAAQKGPGVDAVIGYYGGKIAQHLDSAPHSPTLLHYGETDPTIPMADVERVKAQRPEAIVHVYPAGHGFNCDERAAFEPKSALLAWGRSFQWLTQHIG